MFNFGAAATRAGSSAASCSGWPAAPAAGTAAAAGRPPPGPPPIVRRQDRRAALLGVARRLHAVEPARLLLEERRDLRVLVAGLLLAHGRQAAHVAARAAPPGRRRAPARRRPVAVGLRRGQLHGERHLRLVVAVRRHGRRQGWCGSPRHRGLGVKLRRGCFPATYLINTSKLCHKQ